MYMHRVQYAQIDSRSPCTEEVQARYRSRTGDRPKDPTSLVSGPLAPSPQVGTSPNRQLSVAIERGTGRTAQ